MIHTSQPVSVASVVDGNWERCRACERSLVTEGVRFFEAGLGRLALKVHNAGDRSSFMIAPVPLPLGSDENVTSRNNALPITVQFDVGKAELKIDPLMMRLLLLSGHELRPYAYERLPYPGCIGVNYFDYDKAEAPDSVDRVSDQLIAIPKGGCITFFYETTELNPDQEFMLVLDGAVSSGVALELPRFKFAKGSRSPGW